MIQIDSNIKEIVDLINKFPDLETFSCCGGHENNTEFQCATGDFVIGFDVCSRKRCSNLPSKQGWSSIGKLSQAIMDYEAECGIGNIEIIFCNLAEECEDPEGLCNSFEIHGSGVDRNALFRIIKERMER